MNILVLLLQLSMASPDIGEQLLAEGRDLLRQGQYQESALMLETVAAKAEQSNADPVYLAIVLNDLAEAYRNLADYAKAEPLYARAVAVLRNDPESSRQLIMVLNNQGTFYRERASYFRSAAAYQEALALAKKAHLENDPLVGSTLNGMAAVSSALHGDLKTAQRLLERSLRIREAALGPEHLDISETLNNLGVIWFQRKKFAQADAAFSRALQITEKHLGSDHPDVAISLSNLGLVYVERKRYQAAEKVFVRALDIRRRRLPRDHPAVAESLFHLAGVMMKQNRSAEAEPLLQEAVEIRSQNPKASSIDVLTLQRYAVVLRVNGRPSDADVVAARARYMEAELKFVMKP